MRLGTDVVAVCWAEQMETNNRVEMAIATMVLKRRIEAPCGRSPGFRIQYFPSKTISRLGSQREVWQHGAEESQGRDSGADFSRAQGKGFLTPAARRNNQRIPCRSSLPEFLNN